MWKGRIKQQHSRGNRIHDLQESFLVTCGSWNASAMLTLRAYVYLFTFRWTLEQSRHTGYSSPLLLFMGMMISGGSPAEESLHLILFCNVSGTLSLCERQAQLKRSETVIQQLCIINSIHVLVLELKVCKSLSLRYHMRDIWFKLNRLALIIPSNYLIPNVFEKFAVVLSLGWLMNLLPFCADFILKLLKFFIELCASSPVQLMVFCDQIVTKSFTPPLQAHEFLVLLELLLLLAGQLLWRGCILDQTCIAREL